MSPVFEVVLLWPRQTPAGSTEQLADSRLARIADSLRGVGIAVAGAVYTDDTASDVRRQLLRTDGVLVWVNPVEQGRSRTRLNALLREVAATGVLVSAHPDVIDKIGTKEVLYRTRHLGWGCDTRLYPTPEALREQLPVYLAEGLPRVLKRCRGNGGDGVWKVSASAPRDGPHRALTLDSPVQVRHAARGSVEQRLLLREFIAQCAPYFADGGCMVDQAYQPRLTEGMVRCYLVRDRVAGFGEQKINALYPAPPGAPPGAAPEPGPRLYYPPSRVDFQSLKRRLEDEWLPALCAVQAVERNDLPLIWDADFLHAAPIRNGEPGYVLCEINASCVFPFPDDALAPLADETLRQLTLRAAAGQVRR